MTREIKFQCFPGINTGERVVTTRPLLRRRRCSATRLGPLTFQYDRVFICISYSVIFRLNIVILLYNKLFFSGLFVTYILGPTYPPNHSHPV